MKTYAVKAGDIERRWHAVDASGKTLGRLASEVAKLLMGKNKPVFSRQIDTGDFVVVTNAAKVRVTGNKMKTKIYYNHSGYPNGLRSTSLEKLLDKDPAKVFEHAVKGMLPDNRLGKEMFRKLRVYGGGEHPHQGQLRTAVPEKEGK